MVVPTNWSAPATREVLETLVEEHARNIERDGSYSALNASMPVQYSPSMVATVVLDFIEMLIIDGVVTAEQVECAGLSLDDPLG